MNYYQRTVLYVRILIFSLITIVGIIIFASVTYADDFTANSYEEIKNNTYKAMLKRQSTVTITYTGTDKEVVINKFKQNDFLTDIENMDDSNTSDDGIYMMEAAYDGYAYNYTTVSNGIRITLKFQWAETLQELEYVNNQVNNIINTTGVKNMNNAYDRAMALKEYMNNNVIYGKSYKNTPYVTLTTGKATCHSYTLLYYKLLKAADVDSYYVTGYISSGDHAWNIIKLDGKWYNIDVTFEGTHKDNSFSFKGTTSFSITHTYDSKFTDSSFTSKFNISTTDFDRNNYVGNDLVSSNIQNQCVSKDKDASVQLNAQNNANDTITNNSNTTNNTCDNVQNNDNSKEDNNTTENTSNTQTDNTCNNTTNNQCNRTTNVTDNQSSSYDSSPKTGDSSPIVICIVIGIISLIAGAIVVIIKKRKNTGHNHI